MLGPFATASRCYIAIHQVSLLSHTSYTCSYSAGVVRCPRRQQQRQRVTEGTTMAPWNGPNYFSKLNEFAAFEFSNTFFLIFMQCCQYVTAPKIGKVIMLESRLGFFFVTLWPLYCWAVQFSWCAKNPRHWSVCCSTHWYLYVMI